MGATTAPDEAGLDEAELDEAEPAGALEDATALSVGALDDALA